MQKFIFFLLVIISLTWGIYLLNTSYSEGSKYDSQIIQCIEENKWWDPLSIENFVCISSKNNEEIAYQVVLDLMFKEIDNEIENYLFQLEEDKDYCFWEKSQEGYIKCLDDIYDKFEELWEYHEKYKELCNWKIIEETMKFFWWKTSIAAWKDFIYGNEGSCNSLIKTKLSINKYVAINVLKLNKDQVRKDERKEYVQKERIKYDNLLEQIMINLRFLERIWLKTPSFTKNPY